MKLLTTICHAYEKLLNTRRHRTQHNLQQHGFTLIEILIALFIFAIISVMTAVGIRRMINTQQHVAISTQSLQRLQLAMTLFEHDIHAINPHRIKTDETTAGGLIQSGGGGIEFITANNINPGMYAARGILRQVAYRVMSGIWTRITWPVADPLTSTPNIQQALLPGVESFQIKYINQQGQELSSWPPSNDNDTQSILNLIGENKILQLQSQQTPPAGIEIELKTKLFGTIRRLFVINDQFLAKPVNLEDGE